jgi:2-oxoglutarate ferredoxin oxidoreductase subunit gamma
MIIRIIIGGSGGQGILTFGKLIANACNRKNYFVSSLPTYSAEMRGGYIYTFVTISRNKEIFSPLSESCDIGVFMNDMSYKMLKKYLKEGAYIILNSTLIKNRNKNEKIIEVPATEIAEKIGDIKIANMVMAGKFIKLINEKFLKFEKKYLISEIEKTISNEETKNLCKIAIEEGYKI